MLTVKMAQAMSDALEYALDPWAYGSSVIAALKQRGFIVRNEVGLSALNIHHYHATDAGRAAWVEWCKAGQVDTRNAAKA